MESVNEVCLLGYVGNDPETKVFGNGNPVSSFSLGTSYSWKDKTTNEKKTYTDWHRIVCYSSPLCAIIQQYIKKGSHVYLKGSLKTRGYEDKNGQKKYITEVVIKDFSHRLRIMLDTKEMSSSPEDLIIEPESSHEMHKNDFSARQDTFTALNLDDEIPF